MSSVCNIIHLRRRPFATLSVCNVIRLPVCDVVCLQHRLFTMSSVCDVVHPCHTSYVIRMLTCNTGNQCRPQAFRLCGRSGGQWWRSASDEQAHRSPGPVRQGRLWVRVDGRLCGGLLAGRLVGSFSGSQARRRRFGLSPACLLARRLSGPLAALWLIGLLLARRLSGSLPACLLAWRLSGGKRGGGTL